jgi:hypothetical protein
MSKPRQFSLQTLLAVTLVSSLFCGALGLLGGALSSSLGRSSPEEIATLNAPRYVYAVVAVTTIPSGSYIDAPMISPVPYPLELVLETMILDETDVIGHVARLEIPRGMIFVTGILDDG